MGFITDMLKDIPLSAVLRERLVAYEKSDAEKDAKIAKLEAALKQKDTKIADLEVLVAAAQPKVAVKHSAHGQCQKCGGNLIDDYHRPSSPRGPGLTKYHCEDCGERYERQSTYPSDEPNMGRADRASGGDGHHRRLSPCRLY